VASHFTIGKQPCANFNPKRDGNAHAEWDNVHQCTFCGGDVTVSFCLTCYRDHHENGWQTCKCATPTGRAE
jgi:hypothetical protein